MGFGMVFRYFQMFLFSSNWRSQKCRIQFCRSEVSERVWKLKQFWLHFDPYAIPTSQVLPHCSMLWPRADAKLCSSVSAEKKWLMNQSASLQCPNSGRDASQRFKKGRGSEANVGGINFSECLQSAIASHNHPKKPVFSCKWSCRFGETTLLRLHLIIWPPACHRMHCYSAVSLAKHSIGGRPCRTPQICWTFFHACEAFWS